MVEGEVVQSKKSVLGLPVSSQPFIKISMKSHRDVKFILLWDKHIVRWTYCNAFTEKVTRCCCWWMVAPRTFYEVVALANVIMSLGIRCRFPEYVSPTRPQLLLKMERDRSCALDIPAATFDDSHSSRWLTLRCTVGGVSAAVSKTAAAPIERVKLLIQNQVSNRLGES